MMDDFEGRSQPHVHYVAMSLSDNLLICFICILRNFDPGKLPVGIKEVAAEVKGLHDKQVQFSSLDSPPQVLVPYGWVGARKTC